MSQKQQNGRNHPLGKNSANPRLVAKYGQQVEQLCRRMGLAAEDAIEVTQEVLFAVHKSIVDLESDQPDGLSRWIGGIARNKVYDFYRRNKRRLESATGGEDAYRSLLNVTVNSDMRSGARDSDQVVRLRRAMAVVKHDFLPHTWSAFWQTTVNERSATDVGRDLNLSPTAVRKAKSRVLARLRDELSEIHDAP